MKQHPAIEFLARLDASPDAQFNIEHYTDVPKGVERPKPDPLSGRHANLTLAEVEELLPKLQELNDQGAGIFFARNQCEGHRSEKAVVRVRGVHADMDDITDAQLEAVCSRLQPSIMVNTSGPARVQLYWQLRDGEVLSKAETKAINQALVDHGADSAAVDVSRLLRLPSFKHMKYRAEGKTPLVTAQYFDATYSADEIRQAFPPKPTKTKSTAVVCEKSDPAIAISQHAAQIASVNANIAAKYPQLWAGDWRQAPRPDGTVGYPSSSEADLALASHIARACRRLGVDEVALPAVAEAVFGQSELGQTQKWLSRPDYRQRTISKVLSSACTGVLTNDPAGLQLDSHGDIRNARAFADLARGEFLYISTRDRWLRWDGTRWHLCEKEEHVAKAKEVCAKILAAAGVVLSKDQERGKKLVQDAEQHTTCRSSWRC